MYQADDFCDLKSRRRQPFSVFIGFGSAARPLCSLDSPARTAGAENGGNVGIVVLKMELSKND